MAQQQALRRYKQAQQAATGPAGDTSWGLVLKRLQDEAREMCEQAQAGQWLDDVVQAGAAAWSADAGVGVWGRARSAMFDEIARLKSWGSSLEEEADAQPWLLNQAIRAWHQSDEFDIEMARNVMADTIERMSDEERMVLGLYFEQEMTLREIGLTLERTESRICQIKNTALAKLRRRCRVSLSKE